MRQLEEENRKLKQIVADLSLNKGMLQHIASKEPMGSAAARTGSGTA
jgi:putative transposase